MNISGGQKQRVNIARALYCDADIVIFDDPLSAVDAHVGKALFHGAIMAALRDRGKAVVLITHALHFLSYCDFIYTISGGRIAEQGTYAELIAANGEFARLDRDFGGAAADGGAEKADEKAEDLGQKKTIAREEMVKQVEEKSNLKGEKRKEAGTGKVEGRLVQHEKRTTGKVSWNGAFFRFIFAVSLKANCH